MYLQGVILLGLAAVGGWFLARTVRALCVGSGQGSMYIMPGPPGWLLALTVGVFGGGVVCALAVVGIGAFRLRQWANWTVLVIGLGAVCLALPGYCFMILYSEPPPLLHLVGPPTALALLAAVNLRQLSRAGSQTGAPALHSARVNGGGEEGESP